MKTSKPILYHSSSRRNLEIIEPRVNSYRDKDEGPVVFASDDKIFVSCFLTRTSDSWAQISKYRITNQPTIYVHCISDEKRFRELDKGGAIYTLPNETFYLDLSKGDTEWTSKVSVKPIKKEIYESGLNAMIEHGVLVYFCDEEKLKEYKEVASESSKAFEVLKSMESENERRGLKNSVHQYN
jgi:hypothetical protein